jgi:anti-anti-sigma factor
MSDAAGIELPTRVRVSGDIDLVTSNGLSARLHEALRGTRTGVVVDVSDVSFMDSSGLRALVLGFRLAQDTGKQFTVQGASPSILQLFELVGLGHLLLGPGLGR